MVRESDGLYRVPREDLVRRHRNNIGTIVANGTLNVAYLSGGRIGAIEESFISRLKSRDIFTVGGRALELIRVQDMTARVRRATSSRRAMSQSAGSRMPLSSEFADATLTMLANLNSSKLSMRRFREIARVSGLVFQGHPGQQESARQLQASSGIFYEIFRNHDRGNLLLNQADDEVLLQEIDAQRIRIALERMNASRVIVARPRKPTPFAFPLIVGRLCEKVSTGKLANRVERMLAELEKAART